MITRLRIYTGSTNVLDKIGTCYSCQKDYSFAQNLTVVLDQAPCDATFFDSYLTQSHY